MPSRTTVPGTKAGIVSLSSAEYNSGPGGWLGYADIVGPITVDTSEDAIGSVSVTVGTNRMIRISARASVSDGDNNSTGGTLRIERGGTDLGRVHRHPDLAEISFCAGWVLSDGPPAGAQTFALVAETDSGDMAVASASILVEDIGPAS